MMKKIFTIIFGALLLGSCYQPPVAQSPKNEEILLDVRNIEAGCEELITPVEIDANCIWNIKKTDANGDAIDWIKVDRLSGKGKTLIQVRVVANNEKEAREGVLTVEGASVSDFITISQAANPNPSVAPDLKPSADLDPEDDSGQGGGGGGEENPPVVPPTPGKEPLILAFDFTSNPGGWPEGDKRAFVPGGEEVEYNLDGVIYKFLMTDATNGTSARTAYNPSGYVVLWSVARYFGLPAIPDYALTKVEFVQGTTSHPDKRNAAITDTVVASSEPYSFVSGGESQVITTQGDTYTFELSGTLPNTMYYLTCTKGGVGFSYLTLTYQPV